MSESRGSGVRLPTARSASASGAPAMVEAAAPIEASARAYINAVNRLVHPVEGRDVQEVGP